MENVAWYGDYVKLNPNEDLEKQAEEAEKQLKIQLGNMIQFLPKVIKKLDSDPPTVAVIIGIYSGECHDVLPDVYMREKDDKG